MQRQLANGLILRTLSEGFASDREQLPQFYAEINGEGEPEGVVEGLAVWTQDLINDHPLTKHDDIFVIVDPAHNNRIASATLLIPQTWRYEDVSIPVGRPELVGTHPEYRGQGLVRTLFEAVHERSAALGHELQGITGIPYFYRQFGYTMAVDLGEGSSMVLQMVADPSPEYTSEFSLRPATVEDIPALAAWHDTMAGERLLSQIRSTEQWHHEIAQRSATSLVGRDYQVIVNAAGEGVGYVALGGNLYNPHFAYCAAYVVGNTSSYLATFEDVIAAIKRWAVAKFGNCPTLLLFNAGIHASLSTLIGRTVGAKINPLNYKWFLRVPDPIAFLRRIQPVLERRLEGSGAHRYTGELKIGFYDLTGIALKFEQGKISEMARIKGKDGYDAAFPWHLFWNVVFGDQITQELQVVLPDVQRGGGKSSVLLEILFPKKKSWLEGLS